MGTLWRHRVRQPSDRHTVTSRRVVAIGWYPYRPDWYELEYDDGDFERVPGTEEDADELAKASGMVRVLSKDGTVRWEGSG